MNIRKYPETELVSQGHLACQGCGGALAMRLTLKVMGEKTIVVVPACCWSVINGPFPYSAVKIPFMHTAFETAAIAATGVRASLDMQGKTDINVLAWAGDGGTFDIGFQAISGAAERNENIIYVCYDNEAYMNTGIQRSSATPQLAWTTTTPSQTPKAERKKNMIEIMAAHRIPYTATANVAFPDDLMRKIKTAMGIKGFRFIHILSPCPPGWKINSDQSIKIARLATESRYFPLYEIYDGEDYVINYEPKGIPVQEYMKPQARFSHITAEGYKYYQEYIDREWERLKLKATMNELLKKRSALS